MKRFLTPLPLLSTSTSPQPSTSKKNKLSTHRSTTLSEAEENQIDLDAEVDRQPENETLATTAVASPLLAVKKSKSDPRKTKFSHMWQKEFNWCVASVKGESYGFCTVCHADLNITHGGRDDLRKHAITKKHEEAKRSLKQAGTVGAFFKTASKKTEDCEVIRAEALFVKTLAETNSSLASADKWIKCFKDMFRTSDVAKKMKCGRSKATAIAKEIAQMSQEELIQRLKSQPFTISTDGSNDCGSKKQFPLVVRTLVDGQVNSFVLSVPCLEGSATGENIFKLIDKTFETFGIPWSNCLAFGSDNANVMTGEKKGVFGFVNEKNTNIYMAGCCCHLVHIAAQKAAEELPVNVAEMLIDAYYYLEGSSLRQANFRQVQLLHDLKESKMLKHVGTRWLSMRRCLPRLLENWNALEDLVKADLEKKGSTSRTDRLKRMKVFLQSRSTKIYTLFLLDALEPFDYFNTALQTDQPMIHLLRKKLMKLMRSIMFRFVKPCAIAHKDLLDVDFESSYCHKKDPDIILSDEARDLISSLEQEKVKGFFKAVKTFYIKSLNYIKAKLPVSDPILRHLEVVDVDNGDRTASLRFLLERFPCLQNQGVPKSQYYMEYSKYLSLSTDQQPKEGRLDQRWETIRTLKDDDGEPIAPSLALLMLNLLSIPHSSAHCERIFSQVRKIKTDQRNSLGEDTLEALLILKSAPSEGEWSKDQLVRLKTAYTRSLQ